MFPSAPRLARKHLWSLDIRNTCWLIRSDSLSKLQVLLLAHYLPWFSNKMHNKGPAPQLHDGSNLRIGIVHARWNDSIIDPLLAGAKAKLRECGVKESNIVVQTVPGAWELPIAVQRCV